MCNEQKNKFSREIPSKSGGSVPFPVKVKDGIPYNNHFIH